MAQRYLKKMTLWESVRLPPLWPSSIPGPHVGQVCCWFSFLVLTIKTLFKFSFWSRDNDVIATSCVRCCLASRHIVGTFW